MSPARARASARLGGRLRTITLDPATGFDAAFAAADRRARAGAALPEGWAPYVLALVGGAATMALWLKLGALLGLRQAAAADFRWAYLAVSLGGAGIVALIAQRLWGIVGSSALAGLGGRARPRDLRTVWGAAAAPQVAGLALLLPLDLVIAGPETFASDKLPDPVATSWVALSIALSVCLGIWSAFLFFRGTEIAARVSLWRAVAGALTGFATFGVLVAGTFWALAVVA